MNPIASSSDELEALQQALDRWGVQPQLWPARARRAAETPAGRERVAQAEAVEAALRRGWPERVEDPVLLERLARIPLQFPRPSVTAVTAARAPLSLWLFGGGLATLASGGGFVLGALGLLSPAAALDWAALAYGVL